MRKLFFLFLIVPAVVAQEAAGEWAIEKPASNPSGDPVQLKFALEPGMAHVYEMVMKQDMQTPMMPMKMEMGMGMKIIIEGKNEAGNYAFKSPLKFTKMDMNGQDMLPMVAATLSNPVITGELDARGQLVPGTAKVTGVQGPMAGQMEKQMNSFVPWLPEQAVRQGEVIEVPIEHFAKSFSGAGIKGAKVEGKAYQTIVGFEEKDGAKCAKIAIVFSIKVSGDQLEMQGGVQGKGVIRLKGTGTTFHGMDGYMRHSAMKMKMAMSIDSPAMGGQMDIDADMDVEMTGKKEQAKAVTAPAK
jgi:hypothetical protein